MGASLLVERWMMHAWHDVLEEPWVLGGDGDRFLDDFGYTLDDLHWIWSMKLRKHWNAREFLLWVMN